MFYNSIVVPPGLLYMRARGVTAPIYSILENMCILAIYLYPTPLGLYTTLPASPLIESIEFHSDNDGLNPSDSIKLDVSLMALNAFPEQYITCNWMGDAMHVTIYTTGACVVPIWKDHLYVLQRDAGSCLAPEPRCRGLWHKVAVEQLNREGLHFWPFTKHHCSHKGKCHNNRKTTTSNTPCHIWLIPGGWWSLFKRTVRNEMYRHKYRFCWNRQSFTHTPPHIISVFFIWRHKYFGDVINFSGRGTTPPWPYIQTCPPPGCMYGMYWNMVWSQSSFDGSEIEHPSDPHFVSWQQVRLWQWEARGLPHCTPKSSDQILVQESVFDAQDLQVRLLHNGLHQWAKTLSVFLHAVVTIAYLNDTRGGSLPLWLRPVSHFILFQSLLPIPRGGGQGRMPVSHFACEKKT